MSSTFPSTIQRAIRSELAFETWRGLNPRLALSDHLTLSLIIRFTSTLSRFSASAKNSSETETTCAPSATLESSAYDMNRLINVVHLETNQLTMRRNQRIFPAVFSRKVVSWCEIDNNRPFFDPPPAIRESSSESSHDPQ